MIVISNSSPLIALSRIGKLDILKHIFDEVLIPEAVYLETVVESNVKIQQKNISNAIRDGFIKMMPTIAAYNFARKLGRGEAAVLTLAKQINPDVLIIDDKKARNEAKELGFQPIFTSDILREARDRNLIESYEDVIRKLAELQIYLPE